MPRPAISVLLVGCALTVLALGLYGAGEHRQLAFSPPVPAEHVVARLQPGDELCRRRIEVVAPFSAVTAQLAPTGAAPVSLEVRASGSGRRLARGRAGAAPTATVHLDRTVSTGDVDVCLRNRGSRRAEVVGGGSESAPRLVFLRPRAATTLSLLPDILERATRFRPPWVGRGTMWLLLVLVVAGVPALLARAMRAALPG